MGIQVLLVKPFGIADELIPPLSLGWLATQIRKEHEVRILDAIKEKLQADSVAELAAREQFDVVGFQAWSKDIHEIKKTRPAIVTIVGGIHPTMLPEGTLRFFGDCLDYAYKGEGEIGFKQFVDSLSRGDSSPESLAKIPGLVWRQDGTIRVNENCFTSELDSFGFPA